MNVDTKIKLKRFQPRSYQVPLMDAILNKGYERVLGILPRRAGKDITAFNICIIYLLREVCTIYYIFPTYAQGKKVLWEAINNDGQRILDYYLPLELRESTNSQEMKIRLKNGSLFQVVGSDNFDSLMGTNPKGVVFSEYALQDPRAYQYIRPILVANAGWALFISTPRGKNHLWELYEIAKQNPDWFVSKLTIEDTRHIPLHLIEKEKAEGLISEDLILQEYYTSFEMGIENTVYGKYLDRLRVKGQVGHVEWESAFKVHTAWDLGVDDTNVIIFYQIIGQMIRIIDYYDHDGVGLDHYIKVLQEKPYIYGRHIAPHDIRQRVFTQGAITRFDKARQLGINFVIAPDILVVDGIEAVRSSFNKFWIDEYKCSPLLKALENYRYEKDPRTGKKTSKPLHNWASHPCDALRYLAVSLPKTRDGSSAEELDRRYRETVMGPNANMPSIFRDDLPPY